MFALAALIDLTQTLSSSSRIGSSTPARAKVDESKLFEVHQINVLLTSLHAGKLVTVSVMASETVRCSTHDVGY